MRKVEVSKCYCQIPLKKLVELVKMRFVEGVQTEELMKRLKSEDEREYLATVALLDVNEKDLTTMFETERSFDLQHLLACRAKAKEILKDYALMIRESEDASL
jgi:hypothetical protein